MFTVVLLPKSKMRFQLVVELSCTQVSMVKSFKELTIPAGRLTYCCEPDDSVN